MNARHWILVLASLLCGCASVRPDPSNYLTPTDHGTYSFDENSYNVALAKSRRSDWTCVAADAGTTITGLALGLSEANPIGIAVLPLMLIIHKVGTERAADAGVDLPQRVENVAHCGAAAFNATVLVGAL